MDKLDLYKCEICGNIVEIVINGGGELICCGRAMKKLDAKHHEESIMEKHVPVISKFDNDDTEIRIGEILHPMTEEHYIMFIEAISPDKRYIKRKYLNPNEEPKMLLHCIKHDIDAREYCNIHGLWEKKNDQ